ncbi:Predicted dehydrogenase [Alteromonadaceae bacterium Bs31]|nr:Predicted dehydrogenase [Alteromonadaceae bacterium Bs31]
MNSVVRWGIIGCGDVCEVKSGPAYQLTEGFTLSAVTRRDLAKARDYAQRHNVGIVCTSANELIHHPEVDAVYIATPPDSHKDYALQVAAAKKPCCIEKPMAPHYQDCISICEAFETHNVPLFTAYYRRSQQRFRQVEQWLKEEQIGSIRHVRWLLQKTASEREKAKEYNWRTDAAIAPAGHFDDLASHGLDLLAYLLGEISNVSGASSNQQGLYSAKDAVSACWLHQSGVCGSASWNFGCASERDEVEIVGNKGTIRFSVFEDKAIELDKGTGSTSMLIGHPKHVQQAHVENMRDSLLNGAAHPSTGRTAAHTAWVMDSILGYL